MTTDFGLADPFVGIMKAVLSTRAPGVPIVDVTHGIAAQDVTAGAIVLRHAASFFPLGSIHVAVVDPGVGGARQAICIETAGAFFVGPDNGLLTLAAVPERRRRVVALTNEAFHLTPRSHTFHGRDVFAPVAAALASGTPIDALGDAVPVTTEIVWPATTVENGGRRGEVVYIDHFGNLVTSLDAADLADGSWTITVGDRPVGPLRRTYADVATGEVLALENSWGLVEVAVRDGSAATTLAAERGAPIRAESA